MSEQWKPVVGFEGLYEVSDAGRVRGVDRETIGSNGARHVTKGRIIYAHKMPTGYWFVVLHRDNCREPRPIHQLVLKAFVGPRPLDMQGCHNNGDRDDNRLSNLRWDTASANTRDQVLHGTHNIARKTHCHRGHPFSPENTQTNNRGDRVCRECRKLRRARYAADEKAAG